MAPKHLKIFLSSPGDVAEERRLALKLIRDIPNEPFPKGRVTLEVIAWDDDQAPTPMLGNETPQRSVSRYAGLPSECDLTLVILWSRLGTPLPAEEERHDGTRYKSGTVWEYEDALKAKREVMVYRRTEKPRVRLRRSRVGGQGCAVCGGQEVCRDITECGWVVQGRDQLVRDAYGILVDAAPAPRGMGTTRA